MTDFEGLLRRLQAERVSFLVVGGVAAALWGSARVTWDLDILYERSEENFRRLVRALGPLRPYPRGAPPHLPFVFDEATLRNGLNFTLSCDLGDVDLLGEVPGGTYESLKGEKQDVVLGDLVVPCISLPALIRLKKAAGRPRDFEHIAELEAILEES